MNILQLKSDVFTPHTEIASLYYSDSKGTPHLQGKIFIHPFIPEMKNANNITLFLDQQDNITGGQIGKYDFVNGLHVLLFDCNSNGEYQLYRMQWDKKEGLYKQIAV